MFITIIFAIFVLFIGVRDYYQAEASKVAAKFVRLSLGYQISLAQEFSKYSDLRVYLYVVDDAKFDTNTTFVFPTASSKAGVTLNYKTSTIDPKICGVFSVAAQNTFQTTTNYVQYIPDQYESQVSSSKTGAYLDKKGKSEGTTVTR